MGIGAKTEQRGASGKRPSLLALPTAAADVRLAYLQTDGVACVKATGRLGSIQKHDPKDPNLSYKLRFNDGKKPMEDWYAADAVEVCPTAAQWASQVRRDSGRIGAFVCVRKSGKVRVAEVLQHDPQDALLSYKVRFCDGKPPKEDWCAAAEVEVQPDLATLHTKAATFREDARKRIGHLQGEMKRDFNEYKRRLQAFSGSSSTMSLAKIVVGLIPGGHVVSEATAAASFMSEMKALLSDCASVSDTIGNFADFYESSTAHAQLAEEALLDVLCRHTRIFGESRVLGTSEVEPAQRVLAALLEIKALISKLELLDSLGFFSRSRL